MINVTSLVGPWTRFTVLSPLVERPDRTLTREQEARLAMQQGGRDDAVRSRVDPVELALSMLRIPVVRIDPDTNILMRRFTAAE